MKRVSRAAAIVAASILPVVALAAAPGPRLDAWRVIGPGGGGTMRRPVLSPHDPKVVLLGCDMTGAYVTGDGGASWRMINFGSVPTAFAFDPATPSTVYAGAGAVYRSDDAGRTWRMVLPDPAKNTVAKADRRPRRPRPLHRRPRLSGQRPQRHDSRDRGGRGRPGPGLRRRERRRLSGPGHARLADPPPRLDRPRAHVVAGRRLRLRARLRAPRERRRPAATSAGARRDRRVRRPGALPAARPGPRRGPLHLRELRPRPALGRRVRLRHPAARRRTGRHRRGRAGVRRRRPHLARRERVSARGGPRGRRVARSGDRRRARGRPWGRSRSPPASRSWPTWACGGSSSPAGATPRSTGSRRPTDGGRTWSVVHAESDAPSANLAGSWIEPRAAEDGHSVWFDSPYDLAVAPGDPDVAYATDLFRAYRTTDGGKTWAQVNSEPRGNDRWTTRGLDVTTTYGIQFDPHDPQRVFIPYTDIGLFRSEDGGETWTGSSTGIPTRWRNTTYWLAFDPEVKDLMWGGFSGTHDLPRPKMWRRTDPARFRGGVGVSTDGGRHWTVSNQGMEESAITHVLLDPRSPKGSRTLYAAAFGRGVYKSTDNGRIVDVEERRPRARPAEPALRLEAHPRAGRCPLPRGRAAERAREDRRPGRRCPLPLDRRRGALAGPAAAGRDERAERSHRRPGGPEAALPLGVGGDAPGRRHGRRHLPQHRRRRHVASRLHRGAARLRRDDRSPRSEADVRRRLRPGRVPLRRPRRDVDADPGLQLQVGPARDPRPEGRLEGLRHHLRRQRVARPRGRRSRRHGGRRPGFLPARAARRGEHPRHARVPGGPGEEGRQGRRWPATRRARSPTRSSPRWRRTRPP